MQLAISTLLGIVTAAGLGAALSQLKFETGCAWLVTIVALSLLVVPISAWRHCVYCGIGGVASGVMLMLIFMCVTLGRVSGSTYDETGPLNSIVFAWRPWIVFCGSLVGGTAGLLLFQNRKQIDVRSELADN